jgi:hypothetical protein
MGTIHDELIEAARELLETGWEGDRRVQFKSYRERLVQW